MSVKQLLIFGAGGHGRVVADIAELSGYSLVQFCDARFPGLSDNLIWPVVRAHWANHELGEEWQLFIAIGNNAVRKREMSEAFAGSIPMPVLIHPRAAVSRHAKIGAGSIVMAGAVVNAGAEIGRGVIINTGATVDHDCQIGDFCHISPGVNLAGGVFIEELAWIGIGSCVREACRIGRNSVVAGGSTVIRDVPEGATVCGNPADRRLDSPAG